MRKLPIFSLFLLTIGIVSFSTRESKLLWSPAKDAATYVVRSRPPNSLIYSEFPSTSDTTFPLNSSDLNRFFSVASVSAKDLRGDFSNEIQFTPPAGEILWPNNKTLKFKLYFSNQGQLIELEWRQTNIGVDTGWRPLTRGVDFFVNTDTLTLEMSRVANSSVTGNFTNVQSFRARLSTVDNLKGLYAYPPSDFKFIRPISLDIEKIEVIL